MEQGWEGAPPEEWTASELFHCLQALSVIDPEDEFENWMHARTDMIRMVEDELGYFED